MEDYRTIKLSRRERQIMDIVYQHGRVSVADVLKYLPRSAPSYSTVRALLRILEEKGYLTHREKRQTLHLLSDAITPSGGTFRTQTDFSDVF